MEASQGMEGFGSLGVIAMMVMFIGVAYWAFRPRFRDRYRDKDDEG